MNSELVVSLMDKLGNIDPPGCLSEFVEHPFPPNRKRHCVELGFVMEHRFAFYYWIKSKQKLLRDRHTNGLIDDEQFTPPDLVTWDWHDDCGTDSDVIEDKLATLNQADEEKVRDCSIATGADSEDRSAGTGRIDLGPAQCLRVGPQLGERLDPKPNCVGQVPTAR